MGNGIKSSAIGFFVNTFLELKLSQCMFNDHVSGH